MLQNRARSGAGALIARAIAALLLLLAPLEVSATGDPESLRALHAQDQLLHAIGYRLASSAGDLCTGPVPLPGFGMHDLGQYPGSEQDTARAVFGFDALPLVLAVAPTSPAAAAGLQVGDAVLAIDGTLVPAGRRRARNSYARMAALLALLDTALVDGAIDLRIARAGRPLDLRFTPVRGCASKFQVKPSAAFASQADGSFVEMTSGAIAFAGEEDQIAAIVAHELAHNILRHRARLDAAGIDRGMFGQFGRSARLIRRTEEEADRLGVYLMDRAGYPTAAIVTFWERFRRRNILGFLSAPTHMGEGDRIALVEAEIVRIAAMKAAGQSPRPAFMAGDALPPLE